MSSTKKTNKTYNETQTAAPPTWTMPGIEEVADRVTAALDTLPGDRYEGNFTAIPDANRTDYVSSLFRTAGGQAGSAATQLWGLANEFAGGQNRPEFGAGDVFRGANLPGAPELPGMADFTRAELFDGPDMTQLFENITGLGRLDGYTAADILARPDFMSFAPTLLDSPELLRHDPNQWSAGDDGGRLQAALEAAAAPFTRQLTEQILPTLRSSAIDAGAYTGDRALKILPQQAIAEVGSRANEVMQGLAYEGFQQEQNRSLQAWQAFEQLMQQMTQGQNAAAIDRYSAGNDALLRQFGILADAEAATYGIEQDARLRNAENAARFGLEGAGLGLEGQGMMLNALLDAYGIRQNAAIDIAGQENAYNQTGRGQDIQALLDIFGIQTDAELKQGDLLNEAFGLMTERGLGVADAGRADAGVYQSLLRDAMLNNTAKADLNLQSLDLETEREAAVVADALARDQYNLEYPFRGLDIATQLLTQLSQNWGTATRSGEENTTTKSSGLGGIVQGIAGLASMAASLGAFGPLGAAGSAAAGAGTRTPTSSIYKA